MREEEEGGIITLFALAVVAPFEAWEAHKQTRRLLSPHELELRRATRPLGVAALLAWAVWQFGARNTGDLLAPLILNPSANWVPAVLLGAIALHGLASVIISARRSWGVRSDRMLPVWALLKLGAGLAGLQFLGFWNADVKRDLDIASVLWPVLVAASLWCAVIGGMRLVLLTVGGGSALDEMTNVIETKNAPMVAARRRRPWWKIL